MLPSDQMLITSQHVRECPLCTREINQLKEFLSDLTPNAEDNLLLKTKVLIARLVGEQDGSSAIGEPSLALRGESEGPITFVVEGIVIVLDVQPTNEGKVNILGQVAADDQDAWFDALAALYQDGQLEISTTVDDLGTFHFNSIFPGQKELHITPKNGTVVVIPNFEVSG
jgi:hypothetical protein